MKKNFMKSFCTINTYYYVSSMFSVYNTQVSHLFLMYIVFVTIPDHSLYLVLQCCYYIYKRLYKGIFGQNHRYKV